MAKHFQQMLATGGMHVGIASTGANQMVAIANTIHELIEVRKFATNMEQVLYIEYDKHKFAGLHITEEERIEAGLPKPKNRDGDDDDDDDEHDEL